MRNWPWSTARKPDMLKAPAEVIPAVAAEDVPVAAEEAAVTPAEAVAAEEVTPAAVTDSKNRADFGPAAECLLYLGPYCASEGPKSPK